MALIHLALLSAMLPVAPHPAAPFPAILTDAPIFTRVAPGVHYGDYEMTTADGPLSIRVLSIDLREPTVRIETMLAHDRLISDGETVSSMAHRSGAIAGINGDYFDINQTNQPLNILIAHQRLVRVPMHRWAIAFDRNKTPAFDEFEVKEFANIGGSLHPLTPMNDWPPPGGGAGFITPEYGPLRAVDNVTEIQLQLVDGIAPFATYRVLGIADNTRVQPPGYYLAAGLNAYTSIGVPDPGTTIAIQPQSNAQLQDIQSAIGGGPLLVKDGHWFADPDGPSGGEFATHMPASAIAVTRAGNLLLFEIDGRQPELSIGVLQPQLAALLIAFGAVTGMQLDGGGSSTIVARAPGDDRAIVLNSPSDGIERPVGDALFIYSDAPAGPPAQIVSNPQTVRALPKAHVPLRLALIDAAGHAVRAAVTQVSVVPARLGTVRNGEFIAGTRSGSGYLHAMRGKLAANVPVNVTTRVARAEIAPKYPQVQPNGTLRLSARAFDRLGYQIAVPSRLAWQVTNGSIDSSGTLRAGAADAAVRVTLGNSVATTRVTVGEHSADLPLLAHPVFATAPAGGPGGIVSGDPCDRCVRLNYDFSGTERAAYLNGTIVLAQRALGISAEIYGDGNGETLRVAVENAIKERFLYTVARVTWKGWRRVEVRFPAGLPQPLTLRSLYVITKVGPEPAVKSAGSIAVRNVRLLLAGASSAEPNTANP